MLLDSRGPRFAAWVTTVVLAAVLVTAIVAPAVAGWLVLGQAAVFAAGAVDARLAPYGLVFRALVAPRLGPPAELEPAAAVRFAQGVGSAFAAVAGAGFLGGAVGVGAGAAAAAFLAAVLNAAAGICLACKVYPLISLYVIRRKSVSRRKSVGRRSMPRMSSPASHKEPIHES